MKGVLISLILGFNYFIGFYYGIVNVVYSILLITALFVILRYIKQIKYSAVRDFSYSPETPPVSILIPAYNERGMIVSTVKAALSMNYPFFDVIVINDGSTDGTLETLINTFELHKIDLVYRAIIKTAPVKGFYYNKDLPNLLVIDKERSGKADSLNCGINASRSPYFCSVDADSVLENDAIIRLMTPVMESTVPVIACGGVVRILNGIKLEGSILKDISLPKSGLALFQIVEYLRAFLFGRVGWDAMRATLIISGAFSLFNKAAIIAVGGYNTKCVSEDMEVILKLHRYHIKNKKPYRIKFIPDPICWTEVPENLKMLGRQRRRWHLGGFQCIMDHKDMMFNPKYGHLGLLILPYFFFFEMLGPVIELLGYIIVPLSYLFGLLSFKFFILFLGLAIFFGVFLSTISVFMEDITYRRYTKLSHLLKLFIYGVLENFGYRQINSFWRFQAIIKYLTGRRDWELVKKK